LSHVTATRRPPGHAHEPDTIERWTAERGEVTVLGQASDVAAGVRQSGTEYGEDHAFWVTWQDLEQAGVEVIHRCTELDDKADRDDDDDVTRCWLPARH
jgi:hypothetical protein